MRISPHYNIAVLAISGAALLLVTASGCHALSAAADTMTTARKRILVTGANKGIGRAIVERLLSEYSDTHVLLASRSSERGKKAVQEIIQTVGGDSQNRLDLIEMDTSSDASVQAAAASQTMPLFGIINNAGIGFGDTDTEETINTNYFGPRRVNTAFRKLMVRPGGRIVNMGSAAGPNFVSMLPNGDPLREQLSKPWTLPGGLAQLDDIARQLQQQRNSDNPYGASKALLHAYTVIHAKLEPDLLINACTPGWILTDLTAGRGATNPPSAGAIPPCYLLMNDDVVPHQPTGRYYGSDCIRSPLHVYRGPGDAPYESDEDLVCLPESALEESMALL